MSSLKFFAFLLVVIVSLHVFLGILNFWYWTVWWFDIVMHFLGGFAVAVFIFFSARRFGFPIFSGQFRDVLLILAAAALVAVLWEFFEFGYDVFVSSRGYLGYLKAQLDGVDTMSDLFFALLGALTAFISERAGRHFQI